MANNRDEDEVEIEFYQYSGFQPINPPRLRMSRLEFEALKLRAAQQKPEQKSQDSINNADATFTLGGNVYAHEYLAWLMYENHPNGPLPTQQQWAEAKIRREEELRREAEKLRRKQEQDRKRRFEEAEERRRAQGAYNRFGEDMPDWARRFTFTASAGEEAFRQFNDQFFPGDSQPKPQPRNANPNKVKLAKLAGVEWDDADNMKLEVLKKKAMRKCHPDTGGSHEKWLELTNLLKVMGIPL